ncbi:MAG: FAD-dependent oxidoreductase [Deltaproteobacteria bacterium]|nr:FAD-dependent oxidoreductase [Deltaproteobacteria bacterium]
MKNLFTPITIGKLKLKNRIVMPAMHLNYTPEGEVTDRLVAFYEERARGGVALIIVGGCIIDEYSGGKNMINISDDRFIPGLKRLTNTVHSGGARIAAQLYHAGRYAHSFLIGRQAIAPSAVKSRFTREEPREMTKDDITYTIENFAKAAKRTKDAGFDAVEILGCAGYLINQFLSPITNKRTDEYGGNIENRMRFGLEVADAVRDAVGKDFTVLIRLAGNDFMPGSNTNKETRLFAKELENHGIDAFNITGGWHETRVPQLPMEVPRAGFAYLAQGVKQSVSKPVIACNRVHSPQIAEKLIRQGSADIVGLARELIADPEMPNKAKQERLDEIIPCIGCNQGCFDKIFELKPVECMVNPRASHEFEIPKLKKASLQKRVVIIGGGPGGLTAAETAALSGHMVSLYEKSPQLGGQLNLAGALDERREFKPLIDSLTTQAKKAGVKIYTNTEINRNLVKKERPDVMIIATGGKPIKPNIPGIDGNNVVQAWDVLAGKSNVGKEVVVIGGGAVGIEVATYIAKIGTINPETLQFLFLSRAEDIDTLRELSTRGIKKVTIIEMLPRLGMDIGISTRWVELQMLRRYGVKAKTTTKAKEITTEGIIVEPVCRDEHGTGRQDRKTKLIKCDTVVLAMGTQPINQLEEELKGIAGKVIVIGDAKSPGKAYEAIHEGFHAAREI